MGIGGERPAEGSPRTGATVFASLCAAFALLGVGCESADPVTETDDGIISLSMEEAEVEIGDTLSIRAEHRQLDGSVRSVDPGNLAWESSDPDIASVDDGEVTAHHVGEVHVTASGPGGTSARANLRVRTRPTSFEIVSDELDEAPAGEALPDSVVVRLLDQHGEPASGFPVRFSVIEGDGEVSPDVTQTDDDGLARTEWTLGPMAGEQTLEVNRTNGQGPSITVSVVASAQGAAVIKALDGASSGIAGQLVDPPPTVEVSDAHGNPVPEAPVTWTVTGDGGGSVEPDASETDDEGIAEAAWSLGPLSGSQTLEAELEDGNDGAKVEFVVEASTPPDASIHISPSSLELDPGAEAELTATILDEEGNEVSDPDLSWSSSDDDAVAVTGEGHEAVVTAVDEGTVQVVADSDGVTATVEVTVTASPVEIDAVDITPASAELEEGETVTFTATVLDDDGEEMEEETVHWSSSDTSVLTLSANDGTATATAVDEGTATVTAEAGGETASADVTVDPEETAPAVETVEVSPTSAELEPDESVDLTATVLDESGEPMPDEDVEWATSDESVATVDGDGHEATVTAVAEGTAEISARAQDQEGAAGVTVSSEELMVQSVEVSPSDVELETGETAELTATPLDQHGEEMEDAEVTWSSTDASVATVEGSSRTALVTAESEGEATITAEAGGHTDAAAVAVTDPSLPPPSGDIPAFPEAEGWGATALNDCRDRPLVVHEVTNTNDSGPGSFRDAVENQTSGRNYDIIIFRTGGTIESRSQILLRSHCVYIAGQTAPGDGILIRSHPTDGHNGHLVRVGNRTNVVVRYLRLRHGHEGGYGGGGIGIIGSGGARNIVFDHLSTTWGGRNAHIQVSRSIDDTPTTENISIQNNLIAEGFHNRGAMTTGSSHVDELQFYVFVSFHRNLMSTIGQRFPFVASGDAAVDPTAGAEVVNNLMYNASNRFTEARGRTVLDFVKNYQDPGPHHDFSCCGVNRWDPGQPTGSREPLSSEEPGSLFLEGNVHTDYDGPEFELWRQRYDESELLPSTFQRSMRMPPPPFPIAERSAWGARDWTLDHSGASLRLACDGSWVPNRDEVDQRIVQHVRNDTPPASTFDSTVEAVHGGWPRMDPGTPCADSSGDGVPDAWLEAKGLDPLTPPSADSITASGYLLIEHYLNGTHPDL